MFFSGSTHGSARRSEAASVHTMSTHGEGAFLLSYRFPGSAVPRGGARARLQVALLRVGRLVQDVAVVVVEPLAVGPLANHEASLPSPAAGLSALRTDRGRFLGPIKADGAKPRRRGSRTSPQTP